MASQCSDHRYGRNIDVTAPDVPGGPAKVRPTYIFDSNISMRR